MNTEKLLLVALLAVGGYLAYQHFNAPHVGQGGVGGGSEGGGSSGGVGAGAGTPVRRPGTLGNVLDTAEDGLDIIRRGEDIYNRWK